MPWIIVGTAGRAAAITRGIGGVRTTLRAATPAGCGADGGAADCAPDAEARAVPVLTTISAAEMRRDILAVISNIGRKAVHRQPGYIRHYMTQWAFNNHRCIMPATDSFPDSPF